MHPLQPLQSSIILSPPSTHTTLQQPHHNPLMATENSLRDTSALQDVLWAAEDALQRGLASDASRLARESLKQQKQQQKTATKAAADSPQQATADKGRAISVLIQADFHFHNRLTDLEALLEESGLSLEQLPVTTVLLWGVVAVELQAADAARGLLCKYLGRKSFGEGSGVSREDALALSRLYAVQLLSGLCGDFQAAADWLLEGGAGLSDEQQELLLLEVDEAEELAQEEHVASWTVQDAVQAAHMASSAANNNHNGSSSSDQGQHGNNSSYHPSNSTSRFAADSAQHDCDDDAGGDNMTDAGSAVGSLASTAVAAAIQELGPSVSGNLSCASLPHGPLDGGGCSGGADDDNTAAAAADGAADDGSAGSSNSVSGAQQQQQHQTPAAAAAAAGALLEAAAAAVAAAEARLGSLHSSPATSPQQQQQQEQEQQPPQPIALAALAAVRGGFEERVPSSPSLASWRQRSPDEVAVQDQGLTMTNVNVVNSSSSGGDGSGGDGNSSSPFVTLTGAFNNDQGFGDAGGSQQQDLVAAVLAGEAAKGAAAAGGVGVGSPTRKQGSKGHSSSSSTAVSSSSGAKRSSTYTDTPNAGDDVAAAATGEIEAADEPQQQQEEAGAASTTQQPLQPQEQQQQQPLAQLQSYVSWASSRVNEVWSSQPVQDTLKTLNLQDTPAWELAAGSAAALVLTHSLYRNRRRIRRAAADFAAGVGQTARMALGVSVNPMAAVPGTSHLMR